MIKSKCILLGFQKLTKTFLEVAGKELLNPVTNGKLELILVMIIVPFICNAVQFWVIDNILKFNPSNKEEMDILKEGEGGVELTSKNKSFV